jgi:hypothetical protein
VSNGTDIVEAHNAISGNATVGGTLVVTGATTAASLTLGAALPVASGGTGVVTSTGTGSVVLSTSPTLVTPALGTPASGTLTNCTGFPVANISGLGTGVATFLATPSSANLAAAVTGETGTGALVFATSPTLVTPALGTPASGNLSNCTGLPIVAGTTGTLSVARGGTGVVNSVGTGSYFMLNGSPTVDGTGIGYPDSATAGGFNDNQMAFGFLGSDAYVSIDNNTAGVFFTTSDYRIKKDVRTLSSNATYITNAIRVVDYEVLELDGTQRPEAVGVRRAGVIAHEIQALIPNAASGTKDAVNANGSPRYQSVNYDAVVPFLIKTIQELTARIEKLEG